MKIIKTVLVFVIIVQNGFAQVDLKVEGVSDEIKKVFEARIGTLTEKLNSFDIPRAIYPLNLLVSYKDESGLLLLDASYSDQVINNKTSGISLGKSLNLEIPYRIISAMSVYQYDVFLGTKRKEVQEFTKYIKFSKPNKDWVVFLAGKQGLYNNVFFSVGGKEYETESANFNAIKNAMIFVIGPTKGLDDKPNANYFLCQFFGITP